MSWASWQRLVRKIKKGEPISYRDIEPCETKFFLLCQKCKNFSEIHDDDDGENNISEDEKEITKQENNSPYDLHEYALEKPEDMYPYHKYKDSTSLEPVAEEKGDRMQVVEVNGDTGKSSKKRRRNGGLEEGYRASYVEQCVLVNWYVAQQYS
ncbi:hypothetical protein C5167_010195 [Papaver somniferum]|uniref:Uncharacterized protein n=1 Tax=Papaver somniferum TaxID=3469 RepID=A0A4Y7JZJ5_PAPSO|nr:hypothetical protein C5167_010195 [Papaver somniferum]